MKILYLGSSGSYTHCAAKNFFEEKNLVSCNSIGEIINKVNSRDYELGIVPIENSIQGPVTETLDALYKCKGKVVIIASTVLEIKHCLGIAKNTNSSSINKVYSHPQALSQCSEYLQANFPNAQLIETSSTTAAIEYAKSDKAKNCAVIAQKDILEKNDFQILAENISITSNNKTRFIVVSKQNLNPLNFSFTSNLNKFTTIIVDPGYDRKGILFEILEIISKKNNINLVSIHSRPVKEGFFIFYFELDGSIDDPKIKNCIDDLNSYCRLQTNNKASVIKLGGFNAEHFTEKSFRTIGIIGSSGKMGKWFSSFFKENGFNINCYDINDKDSSLEKCVVGSDVILISTPMSEIENISKKIAHVLKSGQLVVENASIKSTSLPFLMKNLSQDIEILGIHTMFGSDVSDLSAKNIVVTKTSRSGKLSNDFENLFYKHGAFIIQASENNHDKIAAFLQSLIHLNLICLIEVMSKNFPSFKEIYKAATPNSKALLDSAKRVLEQNDNLITELQSLNPNAISIRNEFLNLLLDHVLKLNQNQFQEFLDSVHQTRTYFNS